ncbi:MAG: beta-hydroxyacyl-ACP dehydratase [Phycisphaerales bacterium]|nr:beta-hydroxyacyl-ACP dehydratase [Phycisphaerales bacterium]
MRWMWIDRVIELVPGQRLVAIKNVSLAEEHLHDHFAADPPTPGSRGRPALPVMPASLILEGMAQTAGILVGHASGFATKVILAKIGTASLERDAGPGCTLRYTATIERMDLVGASTSGVVELMDHAAGTADQPARFERIGVIDLMFSHLDHNMGAAGAPGAAFPKHNFVFGEGFKTLLRTSGF